MQNLHLVRAINAINRSKIKSDSPITKVSKPSRLSGIFGSDSTLSRLFSGGSSCSCSSRSESSESEQDKPKKRRLSMFESQLPPAKKRALSSDTYFYNVRNLIRRENISKNHVVPKYPDVKKTLHAGDRRNAVNIIMAASRKLGLELGTPSYAVLIMDRFLSHISTAISPNSLAVMAMTCLNIAGKIYDLDGSRCGSRSMMNLIRACCREEDKQFTMTEFVTLVNRAETQIMSCIDSEALGVPTVLEYVNTFTGWGDSKDYDDKFKWLGCVFMCDVYCAHTEYTEFKQYDVAKAIVDMQIQSPPARCVCCNSVQCISDPAPPIKRNIARSVLLYFMKSGERVQTDPYVGVRTRHSDNSAAEYIKNICELEIKCHHTATLI